MSLLSNLKVRLASISSDVSLAIHKYVMVHDFLYMMARVAEVQYGTYTGTGANITVVVNGDPKVVMLFDQTQSCLGVYISGMADASYFMVDNAAVAYVAAAGVTVGVDSFVIGADANINTGADVGFWLAIS